MIWIDPKTNIKCEGTILEFRELSGMTAVESARENRAAKRYRRGKTVWLHEDGKDGHTEYSSLVNLCDDLRVRYGMNLQSCDISHALLKNGAFTAEGIRVTLPDGGFIPPTGGANETLKLGV